MVFSGKEGIHWYFFPTKCVCVTLLICISNHAFLVCFQYKCLQMPYDKLLINLTCSVSTGKYWTSVFLYKPRPTCSVCTKKTSIRYFSVQTSRSVNNKKLLTYQCLTPIKRKNKVVVFTEG